MPAAKPATPLADVTDSLEQVFQPEGPLAGLLPAYEHRPEQTQAAAAVEEAFRSRRHCLVEAGTGVGKTLAYLVPAVRAISQGQRVVVSTHTINLQVQLLEKDIPLVRRLFPRVDVRPVLMKGRGNYLCLQDLDAAEADLFKASDPLFRKVKAWARKTKTGDVADLPFVYPDWHEVAANPDTCRRQDCRYYERCHYFQMRRRAGNANLFVVNHALFLSDLALRRAEPNNTVIPDYHLVVLDEAHHLEDVATKVFGIELASRHVPRFAERLARSRGLELEGARVDALERLNAELFAAFATDRAEFFFRDALGDEGEEAARSTATRLCAVLAEIQGDLLKQAREADEGLRDRLEGLANIGGRLRQEIHTLFFDEDPGCIRWGERGAPPPGTRVRKAEVRTSLHYSPIDVGRVLEEMLWPTADSVVLTSATLSNSGGFSYLRSRLHVPEDALECVVGSPFCYRRQALLYVPGHLPPPEARPTEEHLDRLAEEIERVVTLTGGRAFLLFTSRRALDALHERLKDRLPFPLFRQGDMPPARLLEAFRESGNGCLLGTQTFWEGVDVQGDALSCVVIDRLPFAVPDSPITQARTEAIKARGGDWFAEFSMPQAQIRLKQGFGRLIRTRTDRGIVCVLDSRLIHKAYGREFVRSLPPASRASLWRRVERFWSGGAV